MLFGSNGNNNICLAGNQSTSTDQYGVNGYNPAMLRNCSCWCIVCNTVNNSCMLRYVNSGNCPRITAGLQLVGNWSMGYIRNCDRIHGLNLVNSNSSAGCTRFTNPFTTVYCCGTSYMYTNLTLSNYTNYVGIQASASYGYSFNSWRANGVSGTLITTTNSTNLYTGGTYGSTLYRSLRNVFVCWNTSDKRLKKNIKLIGASKQGYNIYSFEYKNPEKFGYGTYQGVIAQEIPEYSTWNPEGYLMADYSKIDVKYKKLYGSNLGFRKRNKITKFLQSIKNFITSIISFSMEKIPS